MTIGKQLWSDRKRTFLGMPLSFTVYTLTEDKLLVKTGFLFTKEEEVRLYRIMDVTLKRTLGERLLGIGTIHCCTADKSTPEFDIERVRNPKDVKDMISEMVEIQRERKHVSTREFMFDEEIDPDSMHE